MRLVFVALLVFLVSCQQVPVPPENTEQPTPTIPMPEIPNPNPTPQPEPQPEPTPEPEPEPIPQPTPQPQPKLRPEGSPDIAIIGFAGRCGIPRGEKVPNIGIEEYCTILENISYLDDSEFLTLQAIQRTLENKGYSVGYASFASKVSISDNLPNELGYYQAQQLIRETYNSWIKGFDNPTKIILVGHSHGTVWASLLAYEHLDIPIDTFIYLDGVCNWWDTDHVDIIKAFYSQIVNEPIPNIISQYGGMCNTMPLDIGNEHWKDVVPPNAIHAIEIRTSTPSFFPDSLSTESLLASALCRAYLVGDKQPNFYLKYSDTKYFVTEEFPESHCQIARNGSQAMDYVNTVLKLIY